MITYEFSDGLAICGSFPDNEIGVKIYETMGQVPLVIADPPYGNIVDKVWDKIDISDDKFALWMMNWTHEVQRLCLPGAAFYCWGGIGRPSFRPFYKYLSSIETSTGFQLSSHITWSKKRAYGIQWGYLFTREELAYFVLGDIKKPRCFNVPLLETKRGYAGYNEKYPAKSEFFRRTNVWMDINEIFKGKLHINQKPQKLHEIPIEVHTQPGEWVLDPFAGSGTTAHAARALGRRFIVVEQDPETFDKMVERLK